MAASYRGDEHRKLLDWCLCGSPAGECFASYYIR
jgi:hypothetical protein